MHAPEAIKEYEESRKDKSRLRSHVNLSNTQMSSSPISISSNSPSHLEVLNALVTVPASNLAEAQAAFPTPEPGHLSPDSTFSVDLDLDPTTCIDTVGVEAAVSPMEERTDTGNAGGAVEVSPEVVSRCVCGSELSDVGPCTCRGYHCPGTSEATCAFRNSIHTCDTHGT